MYKKYKINNDMILFKKIFIILFTKYIFFLAKLF